MRFRVTNNDTRPFNLPPEYGGGILATGGSADMAADSEQILHNGIAEVNAGRSTTRLSFVQVPDTAAGALQPSGYAPAVPGNWAGQPPRTLADAVNRLAAAVYGGFVGDRRTGIP